ncbi:aminotransferase class I/II-fold pyridoxal phosphate-dependent enzyme [Catellatospora sp. KI3]|uniref:aminotransferase class I/II-fold pyridoxal phosphate-dependent enzyme n=1 Tax=Catellatospora sp. KI3 TaxID=3041620 RepID=UPI002482F40A|nr:aminotransferase class I/II-fold pyridoxal phosphate-dependent enzyme [Catellatospora sp. KI3]MDI1459385.1 aminotransferase class I/II-fold pyridoxal phosphate-dependent enzyme [Catellatospora sp. KI3]
MTAQYLITGNSAIAISDSVEAGVRHGALAPGAALPSVRALAAELAVSPATVAAAYQRLRDRGIVVTAGRHGTRVRAVTPIAATRAARASMPVPSGLRDLAAGDPDPRLLPNLGPILREVADELAARDGAVGYAEGEPLPELLALARQRLPELPGDASYTLVSGALDGLDRLLAARLRPGDRVAVEDPGWAALLDLVAAQGLVPVSMPVDDQGPTVAGVRAALAAGARAAVVTARAQNPTGGAVSADRAAELRPLLRDVFVIEDDHAGELADVPLHPVGGGATWAFLRSAAKPYGPDLRCAVLAGDAETVSRVEGRLRLGAGWVSTVLQRTLLRLWRDPGIGAGIEAAGRAYDQRRSALVTALARHGVAASGRTGINVWVPVPDETRAVASLRDAGYAVTPGHVYRTATGPGIRLTAATLGLDEVEPLAAAVAAALAGGPAPITR